MEPSLQLERVMRSWVLLVIGVAACGGSPGDGAVLTFVAPDGPGSARRIELVLASADPASITAVDQRSRPGLLTEEPVVYYRQRATGGAFDAVPILDGFAVRIEPDLATVADETFVPFVLVYDDADELIAIGAVNDDAGAPSDVMIRPGFVTDYTLTVQPLTADSDLGMASGQGHAVRCASSGGDWTSGVAWKPANQAQVRLLLPDVGADPGATDATQREPDLDCDEHEAVDNDCDDLRTSYHHDQTETCDGNDTDCDGHRMEIVEGCSPAAAVCAGQGFSICVEGAPTAPASTTCQANAQCACTPNGGTGLYCNACVLDWRGSSNLAAPCSPAVGKLLSEGCNATTGCTIDVVRVDGPWEIKLALQEAGPFVAGRLTNVPIGPYYLRAKYLGGTTITPASTSVGAVYLAMTAATRIIPVAIDLRLQAQSATACTPTMTGTNLGNSQMYCGG